ncbi:MAG: hypothetical protein OXU19_06570 [bacterium]|nr:hypothetical protein [bacterium]
MDLKGREKGTRQRVPKRIERSRGGVENHLEDWIAKDVLLIGWQARTAVIRRECRLAGAGGVDP